MHGTARARHTISYTTVGLSGALAFACTGLIDYPTPSEPPPQPESPWPSGGSVSSPAPSGSAWAGGATGGSSAVAAAGSPGEDCSGAEAQALALLQTHCASCHGPGTNTAGFDYVLDAQKLESTGKIVRGDALNSPLYKRMANGDMPPAAIPQRPSAQDMAVIFRWIENCGTVQPPNGGMAGGGQGGSYFDRRKMFEWMLTDLSKFDLDDQKFIRYLSLTHLYNAGATSKDLDLFRYALVKAVNALSQGTQIVTPKPIDANSTVYRIDLRDYEWEASGTRLDKWEQLVAANPYAVEFLEDEARTLQLFTATKVPVQAGDWFVNAATKPPLYHTMLDIPTTLAALQAQLGVDIQRDIDNEEVARSGFNESGVSFQNRIIERHEIPVANNRSFWISYDFAANGGRENIFADPLSFEADGSEVIFTLPNGLHGYMVAQADGTRLDAAPDNIVVDPLQRNRDVVDGISCMSCHTAGTKPKDDELRSYVNDSADFDFETKQKVLALYPDAQQFEALVQKDADAFQAAINALKPPPNMPAEPIISVFNEFDENVDLKRAAGELTIRPETLIAQLGGLDPGLAPLVHTSIKRDVFRNAFAQTVCLLNIGLANDAACSQGSTGSTPPAGQR
jgi:mono/diheme cytochrome c family protein